MLSNRNFVIAATAVAPITWGSTYFVTSQFLPSGTPLLDAVARALPAGLILLAITRRLPHGAWWWKSAVLGVLNIGAFFALLFLAAYRLPGGVAATVGAVQPLIVAVLASRFLGERLARRQILAGAAGVAGVGILVLQSQARLDAIGVLAALAGATSMAAGVVLSKKWGQPASPLALTAWQLVSGGILLLPVLLLVEGLPTQPPSLTNIAGFTYLALVGTALAYSLWFRGISRLPVGATSFLGLLSPLVAVLLGWAFLGQSLSWGQLLGAAIVMAALVSVFVPERGERAQKEAPKAAVAH
ncbi:EamA family transporter [Arthrobacter sp. B2a2-09]|uniref:EamA family transporter n=1 Tax=Arthrobacter sp. B2a2-09 TaxID=2952822 RepID=UPI0022CD9FD9|nr:EamA family transporter [Arthrobacter sp. B2a2-09]MCZ9880848.1 EamA family transporter [Arthrobacter sp. B2a2-09]